jgi:integrase/recombinase XerD
MSDPYTDTQLPIPITATERLLTSAEFHRLAEVPPEIEWFANLSNAYTQRAYENAIKDFMWFKGIVRPKEFRNVTTCPCHRLALQFRRVAGNREQHDPAPARGIIVIVRISLWAKRRLPHPVKGVKRPRAESGEGKTPALGDHQARDLLTAPGDETVKQKRDRAILSTLLFHVLRHEEWCKLNCIELTTRSPVSPATGKVG